MTTTTDTDLTAAVVALGRLVMQFAQVDRITYLPDGKTLESDTDHTVMLGLVACAFAAATDPALDLGLVAQFALVHDLVEVYAGDTPTLRITPAQSAAKAAAEWAAYLRVEEEFRTLPWLATMIAAYEARRSPEARFVKALDKLLPKLTHLANGYVTFREQGMSVAELAERYERQAAELAAYAGDFPALMAMRAELVAAVMAGYGAAEVA